MSAIRPSPNGRLFAVYTRSTTTDGPLEIHLYDLDGHELARYTGPVASSTWLGDSSGMIVVDPPSGDARTSSVRVLELDGSLRQLVASVNFDFVRATLTPGPTGELLFARGPELIAVNRRSGAERLITRGITGNGFAWDAAGDVLYVDSVAQELVTFGTNGRVVDRASLRPPDGIRIVEASIGGQSLDRRATLIAFRGDHTWPGGGQNGFGMRLFVDGIVREEVPGGLRLDLPTGPHEILSGASDSRGYVRYDLVTGTYLPAGLFVTTGPGPDAISGSLVFAPSIERPSARVFIGRVGEEWRVVDLPIRLGIEGIAYAGPAGTFYVIDDAGAMWVVNGAIAMSRSTPYRD